GEEVQRIPIDPSFHVRSPHGLALSPDGKTLAVGASGGVLFLDVATGGELQRCTGQFPYIPRLLFSPDGTMLLTESSLGLVDAATGKKMWRAADAPKCGFLVMPLAFLPDDM